MEVCAGKKNASARKCFLEGRCENLTVSDAPGFRSPIDTFGIPARNTMFGFPNRNWREFRLPWGQVVLVPEQFVTVVDRNGDLLVYPEGDSSVPPSGRMPVGGYFFDSIIRQDPIDDDRLRAEDNTEEFKRMTREDLDYFAEQVGAGERSGRAVVATFGGTAFGDIALVPGPFMKHPRGIRTDRGHCFGGMVSG